MKILRSKIEPPKYYAYGYRYETVTSGVIYRLLLCRVEEENPYENFYKNGFSNLESCSYSFLGQTRGIPSLGQTRGISSPYESLNLGFLYEEKDNFGHETMISPSTVTIVEKSQFYSYDNFLEYLKSGLPEPFKILKI